MSNAPVRTREPQRSQGVLRWDVEPFLQGAKSVVGRAGRRASLCELTNGLAKTRFAMASLLVRRLEKVTCVALFTALAMNLVAHAALLV